MTIGWIITRTYGSGFTEFLALSNEMLAWSNTGKQATIFRDRAAAESVLDQLKNDHRIDLVPVEAFC